MVNATNFVLPVRELESERVKLVLFNPDLYASQFVDRTKDYPELFKYFPFGPFDSATDFRKAFLEASVITSPETVLFAILDKKGGSNRFAGIVGLVNTSVVNQTTEIGGIVILPEFQRTHVTSNAVGLLLHYCLDLPTTPSSNEEEKKTLKYGPGLGLRRVQWQANAENAPSVRTAQRMSFRLEGIMRWERIVSEGKYGVSVPPEREALCGELGRHSAMLAVCWDDWELEGAREAVQQQMDRV